MRLRSLVALAAVPTLALTAIAPASAQSRWKEIGKTPTGNVVYVDPASVKKDSGIVTARIRVKFTAPVTLQNGQQWVVSHHLAMFDCPKSRVAAKESIYYSDVAATKVVQHTTIAKPGFGPAIGGSMAEVALNYFCKK